MTIDPSRRPRFRLIPVAFTLCAACLAGCGGGKQSEATIKSSQSAYDEGLAELANDDHAAAIEKLTTAIEGGGLTGDQLVDAHLKRAVARARAGDPDEAMRDVEIAEQGAHPADVLLARGEIYEQMGETDKARAAVQEAKKFEVRSKGGPRR